MAYLEATSGRCPHDLPYLQGERSHRRLEEGEENVSTSVQCLFSSMPPVPGFRV